MAHQATETEFTLDTAAALASEERARPRSTAGARGISPGAGCAATTSRSRFLLLFVLDRRRLRARAGRTRSHVAHTGPNTNHVARDGQGQRQARCRSSRRAATSTRRPASPARSRERAACSSRRSRSARPGSAPAGGSCSAPTRTAATSPCGCSTAGATRSIVGIGSAAICVFFAVHPRPARRLLRRLDRLRDHALLRPHLGVPGGAARDRARHRALDQRLPSLRASTSRAAASGSRRSSSRTC